MRDVLRAIDWKAAIGGIVAVTLIIATPYPKISTWIRILSGVVIVISVFVAGYFNSVARKRREALKTQGSELIVEVSDLRKRSFAGGAEYAAWYRDYEKWRQRAIDWIRAAFGESTADTFASLQQPSPSGLGELNMFYNEELKGLEQRLRDLHDKL